MDAEAEREKITREIRELEQLLGPDSAGLGADGSDSSPGPDSDADAPRSEDSDAAGPPSSEEEEERWGGAQKALTEDPETCLQLNLVYQEVVREKLAELDLLLAQNREQQEEITWDLAGSKGSRVKDGRSLPPNAYVGHFLKPYFKDRATGVGPPANEDTREKSAQGIKAFKQLLVTKWKGWEKALLRKAVVSDRLQRLLQPKLLKLEYLQQKQSKAPSEAEKQALEKQARETEKEVQDINQLPEETLLGCRLDSHDWEKIANVTFEGARSAEEIRKFWQNSEHPSINKQEWGRPEVEQLMAVAARHGHLQWQKVAEELGTSRSAFQCLQKYQQHNKALKRREWTAEEDRMLTQLVQAMRVGSHVPYRRIVYYMEGRDSVQLIYRWTKSLDPRLRKGCWAPEEDAKLLRAVAKYGEQDWFKIREEVPGRSDAQCRDRYLRRLHLSLKKGRWDCGEEGKLLELIEKYGVGNWAKIASELPQRSGSQCLSKWKIMVRQKQSQVRRRRRQPRCRVRWSSSSDSSVDSSVDSSHGSCEDSEPEEEAPESTGGGLVQPPAQRPVPALDLWVPARRGIADLWGGGRAPKASSPTPSSSRGAAPAAPGAPPSLPDSRTPDPTGMGLESGEEQVHEGRSPQKVPLETVLRVLHTNTAARRRMLRQKQRPWQGGLARPCEPPPWPGAFRKAQALHQRLLHRQLLTAVSPWVGDVTLPPAPRRPALRTRADGIREQLQGVRLASTPVFTLLIQLFQIDAAGCLEVVRERKPPASVQASTGARDSPGRCSPQLPAREAAKNSTPKVAGMPRPPAPAPAPAVPSGPRPKPKTVSELLREKRLREARARRAAQGPALPAAPLLLTLAAPSTVQPLHPEPPGPPPVLPRTPSPAQPPAAPLPVTWVLTTQGLLPVPTVLAATPDPKGVLLTQLPTLPQPPTPSQPQPPTPSQPQPPTPSQPQPPPASTDPGPGPELPSRTDAAPSPGAGARDRTPRAGHPTAPCADSGLPPPPSSLGRPPESPQGPPGLERPPQPGPEKGALDLGLLSLEGEAATRAWLAGPRGVCAPPLGAPLPYQPPALGSLRALAGLLLRKAALERGAAALGPGWTLPPALRANPAYLLLRARFLAAFTLPALLATLPPPGVRTTLSGAGLEDTDQDLDGAGEGAQEAAPGAEEVPDDDGDALRTRGRLARKRRRLL